MSMKVLVVDDSATMRKIIVRALGTIGVEETAQAADGVEALELFQQESYDLVLTDWNMPNKSGIELVRDIRATGSTIPVVMITTEAEKSRVLEAIQAGISDYVVKPFTPDALREKLGKFAAV